MRNDKKKKIVLIAGMLLALMMPTTASAQKDGFFSNYTNADLRDDNPFDGHMNDPIVNDNETGEELPIGNGLWVLAAAAGFYLLGKTRKARKVTAMTVAAFGLTLGMTQCNKSALVTPATTGETITINFTASCGGNKAFIDGDKVKWNKDDKVYVINNGKILGNLTATPNDQNPQIAAISGTVTGADESKEFYFYCIGSGITAPTTGSATWTVEIGNDASDNKLVCCSGAVRLSGGTPTSPVTFAPMTAFIRLNTTNIVDADSDITMYGANNKMEINCSTPQDPTYSGKLDGTKFTSGVDVLVYVFPTEKSLGEYTQLYLFNQVATKEGEIRGETRIKNGIQANRLYAHIEGSTVTPIDVPQTLVENDEWIDFNDPRMGVIGLPIFRKMNIGAESATEGGNYYMWGETESRTSGFVIGNNKYYSSGQYTKYNATDGKTVLETMDDAAYTYNNAWRTPTGGDYGEWGKLKSNTYFSYTGNYNNSNVMGYIVYKVKNMDDKGKTSGGSYTTADPHMFLPFSGYYNGNDHKENNQIGVFMSSTLYNNNKYTHFISMLLKNSTTIIVNDDGYRYYGFPVRPVKESPIPAPAQTK